MRWCVAVVMLASCDRVLGLQPATAVDAYLPPPPGSWTQVALGYDHTCALRDNASLYCWGNNTQGQLGIGTQGNDVGDPTQIPGTWLAIAAGGATTCGLRDDHSLWCWGLQLGTMTAVVAPAMIDPGPWSSVAIGASHACALAAAGTAACWGFNTYGELGDGTVNTSLVLTNVVTPVRFTAITVGDQHTCGLANDASLWCWGSGSQGQLGTGLDPEPNALTPVRVDRESWLAVAAGSLHTCGLVADGGLRCWGYNAHGELGADIAGQVVSKTPIVVAADEAPWTSVSAGASASCAVRGNGQLWCWGDNANGELGVTNEGTHEIPPTPVPGGAHVWSSVDVGLQATCGLGDDHNLWCFGLTRLGAAANIGVPTKLEGSWQKVKAGDGVTCALADTGDLSCWGHNASAQLGDGTYTDRVLPAEVGQPPWAAVSIRDTFGCGISSGLSCWGYNQYGLGDGTMTRSLPTAISTGLWTDVGVGPDFACAVGVGGLSCWGNNNAGQLASGDMRPYPMPHASSVVVAGPWTSVSAGDLHACGIAAGGVYCWGDDTVGELGLASAGLPVSTPTYVMDADQVRANFSTTCAVAAGTGSCWGNNSMGQVGDGSTANRPAPTPLAGTWSDLSPGQSHSCGIRGDGTLWCWGDDSFSQLGDGMRLQQLLPIEIDPATDWQQVSAGADHTCAVKNDHSLWCWGANVYGQLGLGSSTFGKPVFVP